MLLCCCVVLLLCRCVVVLLCGCVAVWLRFIFIFDYIRLCCVATSGVDVAARVGAACIRFKKGFSAWLDLGVQTGVPLLFGFCVFAFWLLFGCFVAI